MPDQFHDITILHPEEDFLDDWLVRTCELIDKYQPKFCILTGGFRIWHSSHIFENLLLIITIVLWNVV